MRSALQPSNPWRLGLCLLFVAVLALTFVGCAGEEAPEEAAETDDMTDTEMTVEEEPAAMEEDVDRAAAMATLETADGNTVGTVKFFSLGEGPGLRVEATLEGLEGSAKHGFHVHENGVCEGDFSSAGGHFNPGDTVHACPPDEPRHAGDMGNVQLTDGTAVFEYTGADLTLGEGPNTVLGKAVILHGGEDDCQSQPSGAAGPRLACGIIALAQPMAEDTIAVEPGDDAEVVEDDGETDGGDGY